MGERDTELLLQPAIRNTLVGRIERARHRREIATLELYFRRWFHAEKFGGISDYVLRRRRLVVCDIENAARRVRCKSSFDCARDVLDVNAIEHLPGFDDPAGFAFPQIDERVPAGPVNAGKAQDRDFLARALTERKPLLLRDGACSVAGR